MKPAFDLAIKISHYAGKLFDLATNPVLAKFSTNYTKSPIIEYGESDPSRSLQARDVPNTIVSLFERVARVSADGVDLATEQSLNTSIGTLQKVLALNNPANSGPSASFNDLKSVITAEIPAIQAVMGGLKLARD